MSAAVYLPEEQDIDTEGALVACAQDLKDRIADIKLKIELRQPEPTDDPETWAEYRSWRKRALFARRKRQEELGAVMSRLDEVRRQRVEAQKAERAARREENEYRRLARESRVDAGERHNQSSLHQRIKQTLDEQGIDYTLDEAENLQRRLKAERALLAYRLILHDVAAVFGPLHGVCDPPCSTCDLLTQVRDAAR